METTIIHLFNHYSDFVDVGGNEKESISRATAYISVLLQRYDEKFKKKMNYKEKLVEDTKITCSLSLSSTAIRCFRRDTPQ